MNFEDFIWMFNPNLDPGVKTDSGSNPTENQDLIFFVDRIRSKQPNMAIRNPAPWSFTSDDLFTWFDLSL